MKSSSAIINKKDLNFSAGAARTGSTVAAAACSLKAILGTANEKK